MSKTLQEKAQLVVTAAAMFGVETIGELMEVFKYIASHTEEYIQPTPTKQDYFSTYLKLGIV